MTTWVTMTGQRLYYKKLDRITPDIGRPLKPHAATLSRPLTRVFIEYDVTVTGLPIYSSAMWYLFHKHELTVLFLI